MFVSSIGKTARQALAGDPEMHVLGTTSRGIFIQIGARWVVFLSKESYRGPLTINVMGEAGLFRLINAGDEVKAAEGYLVFQRTGLRLGMDSAELWQPHPVVEDHAELAGTSARLEFVSRQILKETGVFSVEILQGLRQGLHDRRIEQISGAVESLLGLGTGLTPSGDDLAVGLLMALNRWRACFPLDFPFEAINQRVVASSAERTTLLSANLIACAAQGFADERLIQALDGLVTGTPDALTCAALLRGWGQHSGCDAFMGMSIALEGFIS